MDLKLTDTMVMPPLDSARRLLQTTHLPMHSTIQRSRILSKRPSDKFQKLQERSSRRCLKPIQQDAPKVNFQRIKDAHRNLHLHTRIPKPNCDLKPIEHKPELPATQTTRDTLPEAISPTFQSIVVQSTTLPLICLSQFKLGEALGQGSEGIIRKAYWSSKGKFVAIKRLPLYKQYSPEVAILEQLQHPNIISAHGVDRSDDYFHLILELMPVGSLTIVMHEFGTFQERLARKYTRQLVEAIQHLHNLNIVHRDIKCSNLLSDTNGSIKLADFGCARILHRSSQQQSFDDIESCESITGSFYWMAPELLGMKPVHSKKVDIWSLGCTVIEMVTGKHPWKQCQTFSEFTQLVNEQRSPNIPSFLSMECQEFLRQCLQHDPQKRPTIEEVRRLRFISIF